MPDATRTAWRPVDSRCSEPANDGIRYILRGSAAAQIRSARLAFRQDRSHGGFDPARGRGDFQMIEHHRGAEDSRNRIDDILPRDIGRRAVDRLKDGWEAAQWIDIGAGGKTHAAHDDGGDIAENIRE